MSITPYECQACGWYYPPRKEKISQENSVSQTTVDSQEEPIAFSALHDNFTCPLCGVGKVEFKPINSPPLGTAPCENKVIDDSGKPVETPNSDKVTDKVVIIGGGLAGWTVVDAIRAKDSEIDITLISADNGDRYHKPMLSVAFSQQKTADDLIRFSGEVGAHKASITLLANTHVLSIDSQRHTLITALGEVKYDKLILAQGATPAIPACFPKDKVWHINDIANFDKMQSALSASNSPKHIAVIGAGMVGTEVAEDLTKTGHKVSLIDMNEAPLAMILPSVATQKIKEALLSQGIQFYGNSRVDKVFETPNNSYTLSFTDVKTDSQHTLNVDHILVSTGLRVDGSLPESVGIDFNTATGIAVIESTLQTSLPDIYAIGDCMSIAGVPCRYVAPLRSQATTIAEHILGTMNRQSQTQGVNQCDPFAFQAYTHKPPMIRLKNKSISISATGTPSADVRRGKWQVISDLKTDSGQEMLLEQVTEEGDLVATATLKLANLDSSNE